MMIIFPEDLDFYEHSEAAHRQLRERRERQAEREEAWWRLGRARGIETGENRNDAAERAFFFESGGSDR